MNWIENNMGKIFTTLCVMLLMLSACANKQVPPTKSASYARSNSAAVAAQAELDCEIAGGKNCSATTNTSRPQAIREKQRPIEIVQETPAPAAIEEKSNPNSPIAEKTTLRGISKYPLQNGLPVWFSKPGYNGYLGGTGISKPQRGGYGAQKRAATAQAQADLARSIKVNVYSEATSERLLVDTATQSYYQEKYSTMSRQDADQYLEKSVVMDEWLDPATNELYVWVVLPK